MGETFAICTGRLSAALEHSWLMDTSQSDRLSAQRRSFVDLLDAVTPPHARRAALGLRIEAKMAHAEILTRATFSQNKSAAHWAKAQAQMHLRACTDLLLRS